MVHTPNISYIHIDIENVEMKKDLLVALVQSFAAEEALIHVHVVIFINTNPLQRGCNISFKFSVW